MKHKMSKILQILLGFLVFLCFAAIVPTDSFLFDAMLYMSFIWAPVYIVFVVYTAFTIRKDLEGRFNYFKSVLEDQNKDFYEPRGLCMSVGPCGIWLCLEVKIPALGNIVEETTEIIEQGGRNTNTSSLMDTCTVPGFEMSSQILAKSDF